MSQHDWNVVTEDEFKKRMVDIFDMLYNALKHTAGPYGSGTLIEKLGDYYMTKDGFSVLKHIHFNNRTDNAIMDLILTISHQMVMKVGDGSTTAILAAKEFLDKINESGILDDVRPRDFILMMQKLIDDLSRIIEENAIKVTDDNFLEVIHNIATVATNDNVELTRYITEIYDRAGKDVKINKKLSATIESKYTITEDAFYINGKYLDKIYCNNDNDSCELEKPAIILCDFTLEDKHWSMIQMFMQYLNQMRPDARVLVVAPYYDNYIGDRIRADVIKFRKYYQDQKHQAGAVPYPLVFGAAPFIRGGVDRYIYDDLAPFLGSQIVNPVTSEEFLGKIKEYVSAMTKDQEEQQAYMNTVMMMQQEGKTQEEINKIPKPEISGKADEIYKEAMELFSTFIGTCDKVVMNNKTIEFSGFTHKDQAMYELHLQDAKALLNKEYEQVENSRYVHKEYMFAMERLAHLACKAATIEVGGNTPLEKSMNMDALDDAIKACESAVKHGYYYGNNLAIFNAIHERINGKDACDSTELLALAYLREAFLNVISTIYSNKDDSYDYDKVSEIIETALNAKKCYDLNTGLFSEKIINSVRTDIEILRGAISIVGTIMSANQYIASEVKAPSTQD